MHAADAQFRTPNSDKCFVNFILLISFYLICLPFAFFQLFFLFLVNLFLVVLRDLNSIQLNTILVSLTPIRFILLHPSKFYFMDVHILHGEVGEFLLSFDVNATPKGKACHFVR